MISEFHDLSLKIDQLAELTAALRRENADLRQTNVTLAAENAQHRQRLAEARQRIGALIAQIPVAADDEADDGSADPAADGIVANASAGEEVAR
jgi:cell division protein ZapB